MGSNSAFRVMTYVAVVGSVALIAGTAEAACKVDVDAVRKDIVAAIEADDKKRDDGTSIGPTLVRLAWHAAGTYDAASKTGGSNGSHMRMAPESDWGCNAGLKIARDFLEPIKKKNPDISYADLWTLAGCVAIENMGGPKVPWKCGRCDDDKPTTVPDGRLPDADKGNQKANAQHIRDIFGRMGFTDREMVALICGGHAIGRCHENASGYWGPWTYAETTFSNEFARLLLSEKWQVKKTHNGKPWKGPMQYETPDGKIMMLPADIALIQDPAFRKIVEEYSKNEEVLFKDFSAAFGKLLELGVPFGCPHKSTSCGSCASGEKKSGLFGWGFFGIL